MPSEALKEILKEDCFTEDCPHDEEMFTWVEFRCYEFKEALEKAYHLGGQNALTEVEKEIEKECEGRIKELACDNDVDRGLRNLRARANNGQIDTLIHGKAQGILDILNFARKKKEDVVGDLKNIADDYNGE